MEAEIAELKSLRVLDLRKKLKKLGLHQTGLKDELVARLIAAKFPQQSSKKESHPSTEENTDPNPPTTHNNTTIEPKKSTTTRKTGRSKTKSSKSKKATTHSDDDEEEDNDKTTATSTVTETKEEQPPKECNNNDMQVDTTSNFKEDATSTSEATPSTTNDNNNQVQSLPTPSNISLNSNTTTNNNNNSTSTTQSSQPDNDHLQQKEQSSSTTITSSSTSSSSSSSSEKKASYARLYKLIDHSELENGIEQVAQQVYPHKRFAPAVIKLIKNYLLYVLDKILTDIPSDSMSCGSIENAVNRIFGKELAKHANAESKIVMGRYQQAIDNQPIYRNNSNNNSREEEEQREREELQAASQIVFPIDLTLNILQTLYRSTITKEENNRLLQSVYLSAIMEYITAELVEVSGQLVTEDISRGTILVSDLRSQVADDEELSHLFKDFVPLYHRDQRIALNEWQEKAEPLMRVLEKLPSAEVSSIIQYLQQQLRIADAVAATKDILGVLAEHQSDDQIALEIRRLSTLITIEDTECQQLVFNANCAPRRKITFFSIHPIQNNNNADNQSKISFTYLSEVINLNKGECFVEMRVTSNNCAIASLLQENNNNNILWGNSHYGGEYTLNRQLLSQLKIALATSLDDRTFLKALLCIGEAESGGAIGNVEDEFDAMEYYGFFENGMTLEENQSDDESILRE